MTVILITHHMEECVGSDRLVIMSDGAIVSDGSPAKVFSQVELMEREGLDVPEVTRVLYELGLPADILDPAEGAACIAEKLGCGKP